jgi:SAM-dependent methyltransferase
MTTNDRDWNRALWNDAFAWSDAGEEWSAGWGGSAPQWFGTILPRLREFLPTGAVLEIAPGFGRWTRFLLAMSRWYVGVDLSERCIDHCRGRFGNAGTFIVNDGLSLEGVPDGSFDLVFSFDSLVHADAAVMRRYVRQIVRKLRPNGVAFLHHSNLGMFDGYPAQSAPGPLADHCRAPDVSAETVRAWVREYGGEILRQEMVDWAGLRYLDCFTLFGRQGDFDSPPQVVLNSSFADEVAHARTVLAPWSFRRTAPAPARADASDPAQNDSSAGGPGEASAPRESG